MIATLGGKSTSSYVWAAEMQRCYGEFKQLQGCESTVTLSEMTLRDLVSFISQR